MKRSQTSLETGAFDRRTFAVGLAFAGAAGVAAMRQPYKVVDYLGRQELENIIPNEIGPWKFESSSGLVVPPEDQLARTLYSQLLTRIYTDGRNAPVMLLIAQSASQTGMLQVHRPEVCYPAGGYVLSDVSRHIIPLGSRKLTTNSLDATKDGLTEHIVYWTRIGDAIPLSWAEQRWAVARDNLQQVIPDAAMVRISTLQQDPASAHALIDHFVETLLSVLPINARRVLVT
jgi:EpsI family protein